MEINFTLDKFCGSKFWDTNLTWNTDNPDFTRCFEKTILVWIPCLFLWLFSSLEIFYIKSSRDKDVPWSFLNISKLFITSALIILTAVDLITTLATRIETGGQIYAVDVFTPVLKILTFVLAAALLYYNKKHGLRTSGILFLFWMLLLIFGTPQLRTEINEHQSEIPTPYFPYISYLIYYVFLVLIFLLNCFVDEPPTVTKYATSEKSWPEERSSFLSRLTFNWLTSLIWSGCRKPIEVSDLWDLKHEETAKELVPKYERYWQKTVQSSSSGSTIEASFKGASVEVDLINAPRKKKKASILPALIKCFWPVFLFGALLKVFHDVLMFVSPQLLRLLISFVENNEAQWRGFLYVGLLFATTTAQTLVLAHYFNRMFLVGMRIRTALISAIYRKALRLSNTAKKERTVGEIVNLMSVDAQKFIELTTYLNMIWSAPFQIILAVYFLWQILGPSVLAGLAVMIILIPINGYIANKSKVLQIKQMKNKDERVKLMNEILNGIKVLKMYAWEPSFEEQVHKIRAKEIHILKLSAYLNAGTSFIWTCAPFLVSLVSFTTFILIDEKNQLNAEITFVSLALFNILRFPLSMLPMLITNMVQTAVSIKRLNSFMNAEELNPDNVHHDPQEKYPLIIENGSFGWDEYVTLRDINLYFRKRELAAIVGTVGSGKSSLLAAFLGDMDKISGRVNVIGKIAYVPQQAWIQNISLRDNILFGKPFNQKFYYRVIEACALKPDINMLPAGDQTEIGEKGINLSGGQKQRVSLARAVYSDADIYLLDDPLSAVDSHVGKHIFENVLGPTGLLKNKIRILVTHNITFLPDVDRIVVLKDGKVSEIGTYRELLDSKGAFADFLKQHASEATEPEAVEGKQDKKLHYSVSQTSTTEQVNGSLKQGSRESSVDKITAKSSGSFTSSKKEIAGEKLIMAEKTETGTVKWAVYSYYLKSVGVFLCTLTLMMNVGFQCFSVGSNFWLSVWSEDKDLVINGTINTARRDMYLGVYGALGIGQAISVFLSAVSLYIGTLNGAFILHNVLLFNVIRASCNLFYDVTPVGRILNRFSKDIDVLDTVLPQNLRHLVNTFLTVLATVFVITLTTPIFVSVIIPIGLVYFFIQRFYVTTSRQLKRLESVSRSPIYSHFSETLAGTSSIRAYGEQERFIKESEEKVYSNQICYYPSIYSNRWLAVRLEMLGNLIILFSALFAVVGKSQSAGLVGLSVSYALQITQSLNWLVRMTSDLETNIVAVERIKEYDDIPKEAPWDIPDKGPSVSWPANGIVTFRNYSVRYRPGLDLILKGINFSTRTGEKIGIVGRTGAGKSSLTLALFRIVEAAEGEIDIDDVNIATIGLHDLRSRLTIIPQDAVLFSGTLRMNLDPFEKYSDDEVWKSLENAHLHTFVKGLPSGLNYKITEGGENISAGQRQLVCLSRALLRKTKILILDEATAAVDLETDDLIQQTIRTEFKECTILTIAHRLNTIMDSDRIVVLDKGNIVEFDTVNNLLANKNSVFYGMAKDAGLVQLKT